MKNLYPEITPHNCFYLTTNSQHQVYIEESGNPDGIPVIFLHGGPCSGTKPHHRQFFNPQKYRIILMDQRGCGQSLPFGNIENNTTQDLINDIEAVRVQLNIPQWLLFAGSWGVTLALLYAQQYPQQVAGMILRGVFLARQADMRWFIEHGVGQIYPEAWQELIHTIPPELHTDLVAGLHKTLLSGDELSQRRVAKAWINWSAQVALGIEYQANLAEIHITEQMLQQVQMELHYAVNHYFITENQILTNCHKIQHIPTTIIHGRYDLMCPIAGAAKLHQALPQADYQILATAGHIAKGEAMIHSLVNATDYMATKL